MTIIAWAYMVELEDGLAKKQVEKLMKLVPEGTEVFPFSLEGGAAEVMSNSMAIGFIDNDYFEKINDVQITLATVCNDWEFERDDFTYFVDEEEDLKVIMLCDYETIK